MPIRPVPRARLAVVLGLVAAAAAALTARGPADHEDARISWPTPSATATFAPVLLAAHSPQTIEVLVPCATIVGATDPVEVFGSTRSVTVPDRLTVVARAAALEVRVGEEVLVTSASPPGACTFRLTIDSAGFGDAAWVLRRDDVLVGEGATTPPVVSGFATAIAPAESGVQVGITTRDASSHPSGRQWVGLGVAIVAAAASIALLRRGPRAGREPASRAVRATRATRWIDAVVVSATLAWWFLGPWYFDDGWLMATVRARAGSGSFGNYFDTLGAQMPLGFAHHVLLWPFATLDAPFLLWRVVPVAASLVTWVLVRRLHESADAAGSPSLASQVTLAAAHLVATFAWTITLRPEPMVALASVVALTAAHRFRAGAGARAVLVAVVAPVVATTMHPSGIVAFAPLLLVVRPLWSRRRDGVLRREVVAVLATTAAVGLVLLFADTDLARWRVDRGLFAGDGFHSRGVADEPDRYRDLLANGTLPQLASVLVAAVALAVGLLSRLGRTARGPARRRGALPAPGQVGVLAAGVVLLAFTPSKWIYHFGSLGAIATLALAGHVASVDRDDRGSARGFRVLTPVLLAFVGARAFRDLHDPQYFLQIGIRRPDVLGHVLLWLAVLGVVVVGARSRRALTRWSFAGVLVPVATCSLLLFAVLPAIDGPPWSTGRALLDDLAHGGCPITDTIEVTDLAAGRALTPRRGGPADGGARFATDGADDLVVTLRSRGDEGRGGDAVGASLRVTWQQDQGDALGTWNPLTIALPPLGASAYGPAPVQRHIRLAHDTGRPAPANTVRLDVASDGDVWTVESVTAVSATSLRAVLADRTALVSPPELPLLRCTPPPVVHDGIADAPDVVIGFERREGIIEIPEIGSPTGPWYLAGDAYDQQVRLAWTGVTDPFAVTILRTVDREPLAFTVSTGR